VALTLMFRAQPPVRTKPSLTVSSPFRWMSAARTALRASSSKASCAVAACTQIGALQGNSRDRRSKCKCEFPTCCQDQISPSLHIHLPVRVEMFRAEALENLIPAYLPASSRRRAEPLCDAAVRHLARACATVPETSCLTCFWRGGCGRT
jgi:hypothetical protein